MMRIMPSSYCHLHGANKTIEAQKSKSLSNYHLTKWRAKLERHAASPEIKSIREEIGILRMMLEEKLEQCNTPMELMIASGPIADMVLKIEKCVTSCHKLEGSMGQLLDKQAILQFAGEVINIISDIVTDEAKINAIADKIMATVGRIGDESL